MGICSHLFIFAAGIYAGICFDQHYEVPKLPPPNEIYAKIQEFLETYRKDKWLFVNLNILVFFIFDVTTR